ncbi:MAG: circularly permuted type 2 ATP-grasp protein [Chitinophagales bacterium]|nr:circularly permuted type 2 ATP-grasp protein [Chitinophagales bacterium]
MVKEKYEMRSNFWDEMTFSSGEIRPHYEGIFRQYSQIHPDILKKKEEIARKLFMNQGVTFTVYSENEEGIERIFPFDIIPRIITAKEWAYLERGIAQRLTALNLFLKDIYNHQQIIKDGIIPAKLIVSCPHYNREVFGIHVPFDIYVHIAGIDLVRDADGTYYVLEDNLRTPSGVSYMLQNRDVTKRIFPELISEYQVRKVSDYTILLHNILVSLAPRQIQHPTIVLLTPGMYNSAYYEHSFLARYMGIELVEGRDLLVDNHKVFMKTTHGLKQVDVIYRRVDDEFLDPLVFRPDSLLGVPGLVSAYRKGNVAIVNAMGNGVADDKAIYSYVPDMIKYYLNQEPILKNVPTYRMEIPEERAYAFEHMEKMVVKRTNESGGYGMLMGETASDKEIAQYKEAIMRDPRSFIAQPTVKISTVPCYIDGKLVPRHVDFRPYALYGPEGVQLVAGGLTRVALKENSLVVNSSQGGGSKDTWIID